VHEKNINILFCLYVSTIKICRYNRLEC